MKTLLVFISFSVSILFSQNTSFRYDFYNDLEIFTSAENISKLSSLWMADQISIGQNDSQRLFIKFGYSIYPKKINSRNWRLPDFNLGLRVSSNLLISGRFYGFHLDTDAPQIIGSGLHYGFGQHNTWMISFQKTALNGLNDFRLVSSSFNIERYFSRLFLEFYLGIGSNIFNEGFQEKYIPPFSWGNKDKVGLNRFIKKCELMMNRRDRALSESLKNRLINLWKR